ncbi:MAG: excalibur calcium-binding domain-containing protein [Halobacteriota archaeon]
MFASITPTPKVTTPTATSGPCNCNGPDLDCKDFATQAQAQACYNYCKAQTGRDVFRLDADNDGIACEANA